MKILLTSKGDALNTSHIVNLFRSPASAPGAAVPRECPFDSITGHDRCGFVLVAELATGRFVLVERLASDELAEQTFWLLIAEMQYDNEPRMIRLDDLRLRAFTPGHKSVVEDILDFSSLNLD